MSRIEVGSEIRFFKWNSGASDHDVFRALVRDWTGDGGGHPDVDLSYYDSTPTNQNAVENVESLASLSGNDYWKHAYRVRGLYVSRPFINPAPSAGDVVWYFRYDSGIVEHWNHLAVVRNVGGGSPPNIGVFYITDAGARQNVNGVEPHSAQTFPTTNDYWAKRRLLPSESES